MATPNGPDSQQISRPAAKFMGKLFGDLGIGTGKRHNAVYGPADFARVVMKAGLEKSSIEAATRSMRRAAEAAAEECGSGAKPKRVPNSDLTRSSIRVVGEGKVAGCCNKKLGSTVRAAGRSGMKPGVAKGAIDITDYGYHGEKLEEHTRDSRPRGGTSTAISYALLHGIGEDANIMLKVKQFPRGCKLEGIMLSILAAAARAGVLPELLLLDRGFCNVGCMLAAGLQGNKWIMPMLKNARVKRLIREHDEGKLPRAMEYTMLGAGGRSVTFTLLIVKKAANKGKGKGKGKGKDDGGDGDAVSRYVVFATNMRVEDADAAIESIPEEYRKRWGIETGIKVVKGITGITTSNSIVLRLLLFFVPLLAYNLWRIARFAIDAADRGSGRKLTASMFVGGIVEALGSFVIDRGK